MPKPERGSLMNLTRRPLGKATAPVVDSEVEQQVLGHDTDQESASRVHSDITHESTQYYLTSERSNLLPGSLLPRKRNEVMVSRSYRLPVSLASRLEEVCRQHRFVINDLVIEAITRQLEELLPK